MLSKVKTFFNQHFSVVVEATIDKEHERRLAAATLCVEVMRADYQVNSEELKSILLSLQDSFDLTAEEAKELLGLAEVSADEATSLYPFTRLINAEYSLPQKIDVVEMLWRVALSDNDKDKYEEHLVRQVADLLYVPHQDFIQARHRAEAAMLPSTR
ncbi:MAG: TerB family tellurite resistance protein [Gammaproteobacteria bacterium]|nr:TerB family tellurite resistance protein [Gammaproteobacteria bacterium]